MVAVYGYLTAVVLQSRIYCPDIFVFQYRCGIYSCGLVRLYQFVGSRPISSNSLSSCYSSMLTTSFYWRLSISRGPQYYCATDINRFIRHSRTVFSSPIYQPKGRKIVYNWKYREEGRRERWRIPFPRIAIPDQCGLGEFLEFEAGIKYFDVACFLATSCPTVWPLANTEFWTEGQGPGTPVSQTAASIQVVLADYHVQFSNVKKMI